MIEWKFLGPKFGQMELDRYTRESKKQQEVLPEFFRCLSNTFVQIDKYRRVIWNRVMQGPFTEEKKDTQLHYYS